MARRIGPDGHDGGMSERTTTPADDDPQATEHRPPDPAAEAVLADLAASPTPYHAVARARDLLAEAGFTEVDGAAALPTDPGPRMLIRGGTLLAWIQRPHHRSFTVVGAHTDSPNLRVRTRPDVTTAGIHKVGVEIYGGVLLNSWLDRGLGLAGRVSLPDGDGGVETRLVLDDRPIMIVPQLAIHLDRDIVTNGLKLDPQRHLAPMWALDTPDGEGDGSGPAAENGDDGDDEGRLRAHVAGLLDIDPERILAWDLMAFDTQPPAIVGRDGDLFSSGRIDNLLSSFCGVRALADLVELADADADDGARAGALGTTPVLALYDHEEIGSQSSTGAAGALLVSTLERVAEAEGASRSAFLAGLHRSLVVSADGAHATHPNYPERHEPSHRIALNRGVVVKRNANQRYATDAESEAELVGACQRAGVPVQFYIHRNDLPCGSTIGPVTAARLGVSTVDLGAPQLAMHSARETAGMADIGHLQRALTAIWSDRS